MTAQELENVLGKLQLQSLSDEDLKKIRDLLSLKLSETKWIISSRKYYKTHFASEKKK